MADKKTVSSDGRVISNANDSVMATVVTSMARLSERSVQLSFGLLRETTQGGALRLLRSALQKSDQLSQEMFDHTEATVLQLVRVASDVSRGAVEVTAQLVQVVASRPAPREEVRA